MNKLLFILLLILLNNNVYCQYKTFNSEIFEVETVDEYYNFTGNIRLGISAEGYFSNYNTKDNYAAIIIKFDKEQPYYIPSLYLYKSMYKVTNKIFILTLFGTTTNDTIINNNIPTKEFIKLCQYNDTVKISMREITNYEPMIAQFIIYNCKYFYERYITRFGEYKY